MIKGLSSSAGFNPGGVGTEVLKPPSDDSKNSKSSFADVLGKKPNSDKKPETGQRPEIHAKKEAPKKAEKTQPKESPHKEVAQENKAEKKQESKSEAKVEKTAKGKVKEKESSTNQKQKAMQKFMDSMESEFGIPPTRIVEAMANLSDTELQATPEETAPLVIAELGLNPAQSIKAEQLYMKMLGETQSSDAVPGGLTAAQLKELGLTTQVGAQEIPEFFKGISAQPKAELLAAGTLTGGALLGQMSTADRKAHVNASIEKMNSRFFLNPEQSRLDKLEQLNQQISNPIFAESFDPKSIEMKSNSMVSPSLDLMPGDALSLDLDAIEDPSAEMDSLSAMELNQKAVPATTDDLAAALQALDRAAVDLGKPALKVESVDLGANASQSATQSLGIGAGAVGMKEFSSKDGDSSAKDQDSGKSGNDFFMNQGLVGHQKPQLKTGALAAGAGVSGGFANQLSQIDKKENIQRILDKAQAIAQKGGGSMRVQMTPEGMGNIDLRVKVTNGKVDMQVKTETEAAKKLLEESLGELKHSLASQKLHVDNVKVDVGLDSRDNNNQNMNHQRFSGSEDQSREQARQFLGQFRNQNSEARSGFLEAPGMKAYAPKRKDDLEPIVETRARATSENKGRGINLVA